MARHSLLFRLFQKKYFARTNSQAFVLQSWLTTESFGRQQWSGVAAHLIATSPDGAALEHSPSANFLQTRSDWTRTRSSLLKSEQSLEQFISTSPQNVTAESFLVVLRDLAQSKMPDAPLRAERWIIKMESLAQSSNCLVPTAECYQRVIEAWANAEKEDPLVAVNRAERWLKRSSSGDVSSVPNTECFNAFLDLCSKGRGAKRRGVDVLLRHAEKAEDTLNFMIKQQKLYGSGCNIAPTTDSFNFAIRGWSRCRKRFDIVENSMRILKVLQKYQKEVDHTVGPDSKSYAMLLDSLSVLARLKVNRCVSQGDDANNPAVNGLNEMAFMDKVMSLLQEDKTSSSRHSVSSDTSVYNLMITAWSNLSPLHANAPFEAERVLQRMISMKDRGQDSAAPNALSYTLLMRAWANSENPSRGRRVTWWLSKLWKDYSFEGRPELCPTTTTYNTVLKTHSKLDQPLEAEKALNELIELQESGEYTNLSPNTESFAIMIRLWIDSAEKGSFEALQKAVNWLKVCAKHQEQDEDFSAPASVYIPLLGAARQTAARFPEALDLALDTFEFVRKSRLPTESLHYVRILQVALLALSRPEHNEVRSEFILELTNECRDDGLLSNAYIQALANGPIYRDGWTSEESGAIIRQLFPHWPLPASWTRNLRRESLKPKKKDSYRNMWRVHFHGDSPYYRS